MTELPWIPAVGDRLPSLVRDAGLEHWNRYAAVADEFYPTHMDDDAGRAAGFSGAFGIGDLQVSYFHSLIRDWLDDRGRMISLNCRFHTPSFKNSRVVTEGHVTSVEGRQAQLELRAHNAQSLILVTGTAVVLVE